MNFIFQFIFTLLLLTSISTKALNQNLECIQFYSKDHHHRTADNTLYDNTKSLASLFRAQMVRDHLHEEITTQIDRENFIRNRIQSPHPNRIVIEFENSKLKFLNDFLNDKDLITSIDNFANAYILKQIKGWIYGHFDLGVSFKTYSDGKSLTIIIDAPRQFTEQDLNRIDAVFANFQTNLGRLLKEKKMFRDSDNIEEWFRMGVGRTSDEAYFSARVSRKLSGPNLVKRYSNPLIQNKLRSLLFHAEESRAKLAESPELAPLMIPEAETGKLIPSQPLFEILRKASEPDAIKKAVLENLHLIISIENAEKLSIYAEIVDLLNPKFFVVDQTVVTLSNAVNGGIVIDRKGMGSANQVATAKAAARAKTSDEFLIFNRIEEKKVTDEINLYRQEMEALWGAKCRGDDCVIEDLTGLDVNVFLNSPLIKGQRVVFVPPGIQDSHSRSEMSTHGETIEKLFIKHLIKVTSIKDFHNLTFAIDFKTVNMNTGAVNLLVNSLNGQVSAEVNQAIRDSFQKAVDAFNTERFKQKKPSTYYPAQIVQI
ncbi:MAG: hypothetical protein JNM24_17165 [Bdellovibrionaceae bacterium]|nr:hypothetical protein [Pseudobdellovibrionaceae bacterium]